MSDITQRVGARLRARRHARGETLKAVAERAGVSARYLVLAEKGEGNLSLDKLDRLASALEVTASWLVAEAAEGLVALLGVRGAGKSAVGQGLAAQLERPFIELDSVIEESSGLSMAEIFALHGEAYYRRLETAALATLEGPAIVAAGGSIVTHGENYDRLRNMATTIWLRAAPEDHWDRVIQQGDRRPMRDHPEAIAELRALLAAREPLYRQADHVIETSGQDLEQVVHAALTRLG